MTDFIEETGAQLRRWLIRLKREPFNLTFALVQPLMIFLFLGSAFEGVVRTEVSGPSYRSFLLGGVVALTVFGNSMAGGISLLFDKENGFLSRCLVAPISRSSIFVARFLAVNLVSAIQVLIILTLGHVTGARVQTGVAGVLLLLAVGWLLGFGVTVISLSLAFTLRGHGDFFALVGTITLPIAFVSTAFVPLAEMPGWMQLMARLNPLSYAVDGMRALVIQPSIDLAFIGGVALALILFDAAMMFIGVRTLRRHVR